MGAGSSKFGVPTNPRVELADSETRDIRRRMEIDTPSLIKLDHGTIRYREPTDHRKPKLPRLGKPTEAPHEGEDRVGKSGYFYHPRLTDFSSNARYTKEEAARFHYVQQNPNSSRGKKVFFVMGVGMPDEVLPPEPAEPAPSEGATLVEDMEAVHDKENAAPEQMETALTEVDKKSEEQKEEGQEVKLQTQPLKKEFRGQLVPRSRIPVTNELPVQPDRTRLICRAKNQLYYTLKFSAPVTVDEELTQSRVHLFRGDGPESSSQAVGESQDTNEDDANPEANIVHVTPAEDAEQEVEEKDELVTLEIISDGQPPIFRATFASTLTMSELRKRLSTKLDVSHTKINILHEDKYISSPKVLAELYPGELHEGYRHCIILSPM